MTLIIFVAEHDDCVEAHCVSFFRGALAIAVRVVQFQEKVGNANLLLSPFELRVLAHSIKVSIEYIFGTQFDGVC